MARNIFPQRWRAWRNRANVSPRRTISTRLHPVDQVQDGWRRRKSPDQAPTSAAFAACMRGLMSSVRQGDLGLEGA
jgi:hypothetical protein